MFCPICQFAFYERTLLDPSLQGYACTNSHHFYTTLIEQSGGIPTADTIQPPRLNSDLQVLKFWLSDRQARARLPNELAVACRRIIEIAEDEHHVAKVENPFAFCPTCGEALTPFDSDDLYMQGLKCGTGHEVWWRGRTVNYVERGARKNLTVELADDSIPQWIEYFASDEDQLIKPYVHPQLRDVLKRVGK